MIRYKLIQLLFLLVFASYSGVVFGQRLSVQGEVTHINCQGDANGKIKLKVNGGTPPYSFLWQDGSRHDNIIKLSPGSYSCTITDSKAQLVVKSFEIKDSKKLTVDYVVDGKGTEQANFKVTASGGTPPYKAFYITETGSYEEFTVNSRIFVNDNTYHVYLRDNRGCNKGFMVKNNMN